MPDQEVLTGLLGQELCKTWKQLCDEIDEKYEMEHSSGEGGKEWKYEYKFRRGGKTLCTLYAAENRIGFQVIFGKAEREKFEAVRESFPSQIQTAYDNARTYHDGKWVMFGLENSDLLSDYVWLLAIKRKPNRK